MVVDALGVRPRVTAVFGIFDLLPGPVCYEDTVCIEQHDHELVSYIETHFRARTSLLNPLFFECATSAARL